MTLENFVCLASRALNETYANAAGVGGHQFLPIGGHQAPTRRRLPTAPSPSRPTISQDDFGARSGAGIELAVRATRAIIDPEELTLTLITLTGDLISAL